jgi:hypothetical protein
MTMARARLSLVLLFAAALLLGAAGAAHSDTGAPTGLHGFLLRADEPAQTQFSRTPAFAWSPVPGALHYEFQLSLSSSFRDNSVVYADLNVPTPVLAPDITLPWITGNPHSLYARVRAVTPSGATAWSSGYGFDMVPPPPPTPLPSYPGVLRWTPIEGAPAYEVWLVDAHKFEIVTTNVLDEREFYTFHETPSWTGSIRWRIRVLRVDSSINGRLNSIPAAKFGAWSQTYNSTNPAFTGGTLKLLGTVSDVYSDGSPGSPAHRLMPAFLWTGNTGLSGQPSELFRVEVFTDKQCINRVFTGAVTGAPAYAPRPFGPLALPGGAVGIQSARSAFLPDGAEPQSITPDGDPLTTNESAQAASPTGSAPGDPGGSTSGGSDTSGSSGSSSSSGAPAAGGGGTITWQGNLGAPVDLWDTEWPDSGYYWTVVPVSATPPDALSTAIKAPGSKPADVSIPVANSQGFQAGDVITIGAGPSSETFTVTGVSDGVISLSGPLKNGHGAGEPVVRISGNFQYRDLELAQDACASGRVARFGKSSEPSLTASGNEFVTGLSSDGRLTSARETTAFYGQPLISWTPALGAAAYEVQWSKTQYPFTPIPYNGKPGYVTTATSLVLPVGPGVYYYRVRGYDFSLPTGAQQMSWSDPARLVVAKPTFKVIGGSTTTTKKKPAAPAKKKSTTTPTVWLRLTSSDGFSISVPKTWKKHVVAGAAAGDVSYDDPTGLVQLTASKSAPRGSTPFDAWAAQTKAVVGLFLGGTPTASTMKLPAGSGIRIDDANGAFVKGKPKTLRAWVVDAPDASYTVSFLISGKATAAQLALAQQIASSLKLGG